MPPFGIDWLDEARADVRRLDRPTAMRIFDGILHYLRAYCRMAGLEVAGLIREEGVSASIPLAKRPPDRSSWSR